MSGRTNRPRLAGDVGRAARAGAQRSSRRRGGRPGALAGGPRAGGPASCAAYWANILRAVSTSSTPHATYEPQLLGLDPDPLDGQVAASARSRRSAACIGAAVAQVMAAEQVVRQAVAGDCAAHAPRSSAARSLSGAPPRVPIEQLDDGRAGALVVRGGDLCRRASGADPRRRAGRRPRCNAPPRAPGRPRRARRRRGARPRDRAGGGAGIDLSPAMPRARGSPRRARRARRWRAASRRWRCAARGLVERQHAPVRGDRALVVAARAAPPPRWVHASTTCGRAAPKTRRPIEAGLRLRLFAASGSVSASRSACHALHHLPRGAGDLRQRLAPPHQARTASAPCIVGAHVGRRRRRSRCRRSTSSRRGSRARTRRASGGGIPRSFIALAHARAQVLALPGRAGDGDPSMSSGSGSHPAGAARRP